MKIKLIVFLLCVVSISKLFATDYPVTSSEDIKKLKLKPGDKVILQEGEWKDQFITFKGKGTAENPIILTTANTGKVKLSGNSNLKIEGEFLVVDGIYFADGYSPEKDVIDFSKNASDCRLTNSAIVNYSSPEKSQDYKWVSVRGVRNRVDHCSFTGKTHQGTLLVVWLSETPNYAMIDHNYFGPRQDLGGNGGEIIRVGTSDWSMSDSFTTIENNIFDKCDGETEIVSIKSCKNTIKNNLFFESDGTLTLRHGNNNEVVGNIFIGNQKANTGGIRIIGENHLVHNNYLHGLTGTNLRAAISVMNGVVNPQLNQYFPVIKSKIYKNLIVDCKEAITVGSGKSDTRVVVPDAIEITNNYVVNCKKPYTEKDTPKNGIIKDNEIKGSEEKFIGFNTTNVKYKIFKGFWQVKGEENKLFWETEKIGSPWEEKHEFKIK